LNDAYLILENGTVFKGQSFGYDAEVIGELVFTTGMTGYLETLADPVYYGQIVLQTFPLIGNYGIIPIDFGPGPVYMKAYIVRDWCQEPSNFRSEGNLDSFLREKKTPGLCGIDTRALTRILRENGIMNAMISKTPELSEAQWANLRGYRINDAVAGCAAELRKSLEESGEQSSDAGVCAATGAGAAAADAANSGLNIVVWNFGDAPRLADGLVALGCAPVVVGHETDADGVLSLNPDGVVLSGGPGDPAENTRLIGEIEKLCGKNTTIFGAGLGHQMLALARGAKTIKLPFGHRGANQPVVEQATGRVFVTSQNHGYAVAPDSLPDGAVISYINSNDGTCEGIDYKDIPALSVQFNPTDEILDKFLMMVIN